MKAVLIHSSRLSLFPKRTSVVYKNNIRRAFGYLDHCLEAGGSGGAKPGFDIVRMSLMKFRFTLKS